MNPEDNNGTTLGGDAQLTPAPVTPSVQPEPSKDSLTLAEVNAFLGKDFKDKETALKAVKDTFSYVGKKKEDIERDILASQDITKLSTELSSIRKDMFFKDNPQYAEHRKLIEKLGSNPSEVVNSEEFKGIFTKAEGFDKTQKLKTVLESNPRLSSSSDSLKKASETLIKEGYASPETEQLAVNAVKDAFGL